MIPLGTDVPQRRIPWINILLIAANVIVFFLSRDTHPPRGTPWYDYPLAPSWEPFILHAGVRGNVLQFITYQFLHANLMHLVGNMIFLYAFGNNLNDKLGHFGYLAFYLAGGVFAGCGQLLTSGAPTLGASGSISAVTGLYFVLLPRTHIRLFIWFYFFVRILEIPAMWFILFCVAKDLAEPLFLRTNEPVAHFAHLTGNLFGFLVGILLLTTHLVQRDHYDLWAMITRWRRRREYLSAVSQGYDPFTYSRGGTSRTGNMPVPPAPIDSRIPFLRDLIISLAREHKNKEAAAKYLELLKIAPGQVMTAEIQIDLGNQLYADLQYADAARVYELYLGAFSAHASADHIRLLLGILYTHTLRNFVRARELLTQVLPRLRDPGERLLAETDLAYLAVEQPPPP